VSEAWWLKIFLTRINHLHLPPLALFLDQMTTSVFPFISKKATAYTALLFLTLFTITPVSAESGWPQDSSDLEPFERLQFGELKNGFRYILMKNSEPPDRLSMMLLEQKEIESEQNKFTRSRDRNAHRNGSAPCDSGDHGGEASR